MLMGKMLCVSLGRTFGPSSQKFVGCSSTQETIFFNHQRKSSLIQQPRTSTYPGIFLVHPSIYLALWSSEYYIKCGGFQTYGFHLVLNMLHINPEKPVLSSSFQVLLYGIVVSRILKPDRGGGKRWIPWTWGG